MGLFTPAYGDIRICTCINWHTTIMYKISGDRLHAFLFFL